WLIRLNTWYTDKVEIQAMLLEKMDSIPVDSIMLMKRIETNMDEVKGLRDEYKTLWNRTNKADNLNLVTDKFNRMLSYWNEIHLQLVRGKLMPPLIESKWIYLKQDTAFAG